ncbi:MAG: hypothetical protein AB7L17_07190 [Ilumatobacteraceae bacterium]
MSSPALSKRSAALLARAYGWESYESTFKALTGLLGGMHRAGWTFEQALGALLETQHAASRLLHERYRGSLVSQVRSKWHAVERAHREHADLCDRLSADAFLNWPRGAQDRSALRVLLGLIDLARDAGSLCFTASLRSIAVASGVGWVNDSCADTRTVRRALRRLVALGVTDRPERDAASTGGDILHNALTRYTLPSLEQLRQRFEQMSGNGDPTKGLRPRAWISGVSVSHVDPLHEVWEHKGLGMTACRVFAQLSATRGSALADVASRLGLSRKTVRNALSRLSESRLADRADDDTWTLTPRHLDDVADELGVDMRRTKRSHAFAAQRKLRATALKEASIAWRRHESAETANFGTVIDFATGEIVSSGRPDLSEAA